MGGVVPMCGVVLEYVLDWFSAGVWCCVMTACGVVTLWRYVVSYLLRVSMIVACSGEVVLRRYVVWQLRARACV